MKSPDFFTEAGACFLGGVGGPQPSNFHSKADDMCVSFGSLAQQGLRQAKRGRSRRNAAKVTS